MRGAAAALAALAALAAPPRAGVLVPGVSLGGLGLGATPAQVRTAWGSGYGVCRGCRERTWYFNFRRFEPEGVGVSFRRGRVAAIFTLGSPRGWRTSRGLQIGDPLSRALALHPGLERQECGAYSALTLRRGGAVTEIYVASEKVFGFGLSSAAAPVCR